MRTMKRKMRSAIWLLLVLSSGGTLASGQTAGAEGSQQFAVFGAFKLRNGSVIQDFRLGYRTLGRLNEEKSNAILWPTWLGGTAGDLLQFVGPGKVVDSSKYLVIFVDAIGNGVSSSPSNSKKQPRKMFPEFAVRDMVEAEHRLLTEVLRLQHVRAVMGVSMGGMQAFDWALAYPDFMDEVIPMLGSPQSSSYDKLLWTTEIAAIELDPAWNHGNPKGPLHSGFAVSEAIRSMHETSPEYRVKHTGTADFDAFISELRKNAKGDGGTAWDQIRQREAIISLDIPKEFGMSLEQAAKSVRARMLVVVVAEDHMVNPLAAQRFAMAMGAPVVMLNSSCGHLSLSCVSVGPIVAQFLADPSTVHSVTLGEPADK